MRRFFVLPPVVPQNDIQQRTLLHSLTFMRGTTLTCDFTPYFFLKRIEIGVPSKPNASLNLFSR